MTQATLLHRGIDTMSLLIVKGHITAGIILLSNLVSNLIKRVMMIQVPKEVDGLVDMFSSFETFVIGLCFWVVRHLIRQNTNLVNKQATLLQKVVDKLEENTNATKNLIEEIER